MESAGLLLYKHTPTGLHVLLGHMGGPFWAKKEEGAWSIPKGEQQADETLEETALREFIEETGHRPEGPWLALPAVVQRNGKRVHAWAIGSDVDPATLHSNTFELEWPPRSGRWQRFPEMDRFAWWSIPDAVRLAVHGQRDIVLALEQVLRTHGRNEPSGTAGC
ncbi:MAG: NUDIX domain-containing protein [Flavobacteriales bacterium]